MFKTKEPKLLEIVDKDIIEFTIYIKNMDNLLKKDGNIASIDDSLSKAIEEYLFKEVKSYPLSQNIKLLIFIEEGRTQQNDEKIYKVIHKHFCYKVKENQVYLKEQFRQWGINFFIGILFFILCLIVSEVLDKFTQIGIIKIIRESLRIVCWVALWEPLSFILFGWRVINRNKHYYIKLCNIPIEII
jgi:hypothetical protein